MRATTLLLWLNSRKDVPLPQPAAVADLSIPTPAGSVSARMYRPAKTPAATLMYFHGGGWVAGDLYTHDRLARTLSIELDAVVVSVDYRRPPEAPFPCAFDDCLAATQWAAREIDQLGGDAERFAVGGDSAGGNLAAAVALACRDGGPRLAAQFLIYPATDLVGVYRSAGREREVPIAGGECERLFPDSRCDALLCWPIHRQIPAMRSDPRASPMRAAHLAGLPPTVICTAEFDPLRDEGEAYAKALERAGVRVSYYREPGMIHGYFGMGGASPAADAARRRACAEFKTMLVGRS